MSATKRIIIFVNLLLLIGYINWSIFAKEKTLDEGKLILLELAPVDPRSLMQGDYMRLDYKVNQLPDSLKIAKRGFCIVRPDENHIGQRVRFQNEPLPLKSGEVPIKYFSSGFRGFTSIHLGAESYFFEEGSGKKYEQAKFGGLKVDDQGNSILVGLYDINRKLIK